MSNDKPCTYIHARGKRPERHAILARSKAMQTSAAQRTSDGSIGRFEMPIDGGICPACRLHALLGIGLHGPTADMLQQPSKQPHAKRKSCSARAGAGGRTAHARRGPRAAIHR